MGLLDMRERDVVLLKDALAYTKDVLEHTKGVDREGFLKNQILQGDTVFRITVIGEALGNVSEITTIKYPEIPYRLAKAMRNQLIHVYGKIDFDKVWDTVEGDLPKIERSLDSAIRAETGA
jgi:uncharacterized protein with HEPN domain